MGAGTSLRGDFGTPPAPAERKAMAMGCPGSRLGLAGCEQATADFVEQQCARGSSPNDLLSPCCQSGDQDYYAPSSGSAAFVVPATPLGDFAFLGPAWTEAKTLPSHAPPPLRPPDFVAHQFCPNARQDERAPADVFTWRPRPLGWGAYGEVVAAIHKATKARRAVKCVSKTKLKKLHKDNVAKYVMREADILRQMDHPNIVRLYQVFESPTNFYLVMEQCNGGNLLDHVNKANGALTEAEAASFLWQILSALLHIHNRGFVHRDVKPENCLLVRPQPEPGPISAVKLVDFGLSCEVNSVSRPASPGSPGGTVQEGLKSELWMSPNVGTKRYMAPECRTNNVRRSMADRADIWSLGLMLHVMLFTALPEEEPLETERGTLEARVVRGELTASAEAEDLLAKLIAWKAGERISAQEAARHPWFNGIVGQECREVVALAQELRPRVKGFVSTKPLRKMALCALAHEADDEDVVALGKLLRVLELECEGPLTRAALEKASHAQGPLAEVASILAEAFKALDTSRSGSIEWTELLAVILGGLGRAPMRPAAGSSRSETESEPIVSVTRDACYRAFNILSRGADTVDAKSLNSLFAKCGKRTRLSNLLQGGALGHRLPDTEKLMIESHGVRTLGRDGFVLMLHAAMKSRRSAEDAGVPHEPQMPGFPGGFVFGPTY